MADTKKVKKKPVEKKVVKKTDNKTVAKKTEKSRSSMVELDDKIRNNRKRFSDLNKKLETEFKQVHSNALLAPRNLKKLKNLESENEKAKKVGHKDKRRIMKIERQTKSAVDDLNVVKTMQFKDFEMVKAKINEQSDFMAKEAMRLNEALDSIKSGVATKGSSTKTVVSSRKVSGTAGLGAEEVAAKLVGLYFQEIARTGFKKTLTLSEIINAYQYTLDRLDGITEAVPQKTVFREEKVSKEAENLMEDIEKLKDTVVIEKLPERKIEGFAYTNSRDVTYYLHNKGKLFFFSKDPMHAVDKPENRTVIENKMTGLPILKKK